MTEIEMPLIHRNVNKKVEIQRISSPLLFNKPTIYKFISALLIVNISVTFFFFFFFFCFLGLYPWLVEVSRLGVQMELQLPATATWIQTASATATYTAACGNARTLTHRMGPGIEPESAWMLVGFVTC